MLEPQDDLLKGYTGSYGNKPAPKPTDVGSKISGFVGWGVGLFFTVLGLASVAMYVSKGKLIDASIGIVFALGGLIVLPPTTRRLRNSLPFMRPTWVPPAVALAIVLLVGGSLASISTGRISPAAYASGNAGDDQIAELRDKVVWYCGKAMNTYMKYQGDGAVIASADDLMAQCEQYTSALTRASSGTSWAECAVAGNSYREVAANSRDTGLYAHGLLKAGATAEWESTVREWGEMLTTKLRPFRAACRLPGNYDGFARKP